MSIGVLLVCVELIMMLLILVFLPRQVAGAAFIGFAIGESLALRLCVSAAVSLPRLLISAPT
jgi:hypothetical protein